MKNPLYLPFSHKCLSPSLSFFLPINDNTWLMTLIVHELICVHDETSERVWLRLTFFSVLHFYSRMRSWKSSRFSIFWSYFYYNPPLMAKLLLIDSKLHLILLLSLFTERHVLWRHQQEFRSQDPQPKKNKLLELSNACPFHAGPSCGASWRMDRIGVFSADNSGLPGGMESSPPQENNLLSPVD